LFCPTNKANNISGINISWTQQGAFPAHHTFFRLGNGLLAFTHPDMVAHLPKVEVCKLASGTSCSAATAGNAKLKGRFIEGNLIRQI